MAISTIASPTTTSTSSGSSFQAVPDNRIICYSISSSKVDVGKLCWEIKDSKDRLVFKTFKELTQNEIVESIQDSSGDILWTISRPTRGWYLVLSSPKDPDPKNSIALQPKNVLKGKDKAIEFSFHLKPSSCKDEKPINGHRKKHSVDSTIQRRNQSLSASPPSTNPSKSITTSLDYDHRDQEPFAQVESLIRLKSIEKDALDQTLLKLFTELFTNTNQRFQCYAEPNADNLHNQYHPSDNDQSILLDYEDHNSTFGIQNSGIIKIYIKNSLNFRLINHPDGGNDQVDHFHLHEAFWVSVCVAYLGFRADQDAYQAASEDA